MARVDAGLSGKGWWRMAGSPQAAKAMTIKWFTEQKLVILTERYAALQQQKKPP